jgi:hypothetical protein
MNYRKAKIHKFSKSLTTLVHEELCKIGRSASQRPAECKVLILASKWLCLFRQKLVVLQRDVVEIGQAARAHKSDQKQG